MTPSGSQDDVMRVEDWFIMRLAVHDRRSIRICPVDRQGHCLLHQILRAIEEFKVGFLREARE